jgi:hypothetical protein
VELHFKSPQDAARCELSSTDGRLRIDAGLCEREVRLLYRLDAVTETLRTIAADAVVTLSARMGFFAEHEGAAEWMALLAGPPGGRLLVWRNLAKASGLTGAAGEVVCVTEADKPLKPGDALLLALQLRAGAPPVEVGAVEVALERLRLGGALEVDEHCVSGAFTGASSAVALWRVDAGEPRGGALDAFPDLQLSLTETGSRFQLPISALSPLLPDGPDPAADASLALTIGDALAAQVRLRPEESGARAAVAGRDLAGLHPDALARELLGSDAERARLLLLHLFEQREGDRLRELRARLDDAAPPPLRAYLAFFHGRALLQRNLHVAGFEALDALAADPALMLQLRPEEQEETRRTLVAAAVRAGRRDRAIADLTTLARERPADWWPRFQLGLLATDETAERRLQFRTALALNPRAPFAEAAVMLEGLVDDGRAEDAYVEAVRRVESFGGEPQRHLLLANVDLALARTADWAWRLRAFFGLHGLALDADPPHEPSGNVLERLSGAALEARLGGPPVTVVMPTFNARETVGYAIRSVLAQTHRELQLVVVDDASEDGTPDLVRALAAADPRLSLIAAPVNAGPYAAKNLALRVLTGDYVTFHDADDWMHPERIARHLHRMQDEGLGASTSMWLRMTPQGRAVMRLAPGRHGYLGENPSSAFVRREVVEAVGFFDDVRAAADSEFLFRIRRRFGAGTVAALPDPLTIGLKRLSSLTESGSTAMDEFRYSRARNDYWEAWMAWHHAAARGEDLHVPFPHRPRRFPAPAELSG